MKRVQRNHAFLKQLSNLVGNMKGLKPGQRHVISVDANYGHYELAIGPDSRGAKASRGLHGPIEIKGEIHHLFLSHGHMAAIPPKDQLRDNLRETVIARGLMIHLMDPEGDGRHLEHNGDGNGLDAREFINLAGEEGERMIWDARHSDALSMEAYQLVQQDILRALKRHKRKSLEYVS